MLGKKTYTEQEILKMLKGKKRESEKAFSYIYEMHSQRIYAYCYRVLGSQEDANDIFQESFYKFYDMVKKIDDLKNIPGLLIRITRNLCLNYKRDKKHNFNIDDYSFSTTQDSYEEKELLDLIAKSLELLDFDYREAFVLRQYQGMSYSEISDVTGASVSAVKNRFWRAKEKIKEVLQPYLKDLEENN